jgi:hypothetical protein
VWAHLINGAPLSSLFKANYEVSEKGPEIHILVKGAATFSNFLGYKKLFAKLDHKKTIIFNFSTAKLVDHSFMERLHSFEEDAHAHGGKVIWIGLEKFSPFSNHPLAARKIAKAAASKYEIKLNPRQVALRTFADENDLSFFPQKTRNALKYKEYPIQQGNRILYEENLLTQYTDHGKIEISDITLTEGAAQYQEDTHITILLYSELDLTIPDFALEPEGMFTKFSEISFGKDINFEAHPVFSKKYYLRGVDEAEVRKFFTESLLSFLESHEEMHIESHRNKLLVYKKKSLLETGEITELTAFANALAAELKVKETLNA